MAFVTIVKLIQMKTRLFECCNIFCCHYWIRKRVLNRKYTFGLWRNNCAWPQTLISELTWETISRACIYNFEVQNVCKRILFAKSSVIATWMHCWLTVGKGSLAPKYLHCKSHDTRGHSQKMRSVLISNQAQFLFSENIILFETCFRIQLWQQKV